MDLTQTSSPPLLRSGGLARQWRSQASLLFWLPRKPLSLRAQISLWMAAPTSDLTCLHRKQFPEVVVHVGNAFISGRFCHEDSLASQSTAFGGPPGTLRGLPASAAPLGGLA